MQSNSFSYELFHQLDLLRKQVLNQFKKNWHQGFNLRPSEFSILMQIAHGPCGQDGAHPGMMDSPPVHSQGIPIARLCQLNHCSKSNVSQLLKVLEDKDYIERQPDSRDHRVILVKLSANGHRLLKNYKAPGILPLNTAAEKMGPDHAETLLSLLNELNQSYASVTREKPTEKE
ncbi:MAG: MarR family winged helix-turn-helix transcriptional regulator [Eubacteriaceae bacterium]|nr:MarR family winged helix-turn-helix transcriptional regulator [Eubacteriaceae bacterium]MDD4507923.1 MarR family winged helix-turn-helix transcriptional regulator [Eubacteriaceae bacterium]